MNKPDTARMPQRPQEDIIELIEIVREDEEKNASADPDQDADIIELDDAIEDPAACSWWTDRATKPRTLTCSRLRIW